MASRPKPAGSVADVAASPSSWEIARFSDLRRGFLDCWVVLRRIVRRKPLQFARTTNCSSSTPAPLGERVGPRMGKTGDGEVS